MSEQKERPDQGVGAVPKALPGANADDSNDVDQSSIPLGPSGNELITFNQIVANVTSNVVASLDSTSLVSHRELEQSILSWVNQEIAVRNTLVVNRDERLPMLRYLTNWQVAQLVLATHNVVRICSHPGAEGIYDLLAVYCDSGLDAGLYVTDELELSRIIVAFNPEISMRGIQEVLGHLKRQARRVETTRDRDLVPMANGIFDYKSKTLLKFSPDYVFTSKSTTLFDPDAQAPVLIGDDGEPFDVDAWLLDLFNDDEERAIQMWQIIGALLRPNVSWNKAAWLYSQKGNNGKGTLVHMIRNLVGPNRWVSLPLSQMGKDFMLEPLTRATAIITDENDVGTYIDKAANLKSIITGDALMINRKGRAPISYAFHGFMVQCLNEYPRVKDKTDSFYRRPLFIPFDKSFTGQEKKWIKDRFMADPALLRYVAKKVLVDLPDYYEIADSSASTAVLEGYKDFNDPVREFWREFESEFAWDMLPLKFLYDLFRSWMTQVNPGGKPVSMQSMSSDIDTIIENSGGWERHDVKRPGKMMDAPEPLIEEYQLKDWMPVYKGRDKDRRVTVDLKDRYRTCWVRT